MVSAGGGVSVLKQQFGYNQWANEHILGKMAELSEEQLQAPEQTDRGSPFQLLLHTVDTEWGWRIIAQDGIATPLLWEVETLPDLDSVMRFWHDEHGRMRAYLDGMTDADLVREVDYGTIFDGNSKSATGAELLMHILYHSHRHRAELATYLTKCGHSPGEMEYLNYLDYTRA
jgi:uncharacterized damage-inducible protein DinB